MKTTTMVKQGCHLLACAVFIASSSWAQAKDAQAYYQQGQQAAKTFNIRKAEESYFLALRKDPQHLAAHQALVQLYINDRRSQTGLRAVERALSVYPRVASLWIQKGKLQQLSGQPTQAQHAYDQALVLAPEDITIIEPVMEYYFHQGDRTTSEALSQQRQAIIAAQQSAATTTTLKE